MAYKQTRSFDQGKAGKKTGWCLQNVRLGYGIGAKYANATGSWNSNQQHKDRNVPAGVDVPLYYSFNTRNGNEGHVNVRLANGKVWSDGDMYSSIEDYEAKKAPDFLGWGESVNDVRVIEHVPDPPATSKMPGVRSKIKLDPGQVRTTFRAGTDTKAGEIHVKDDTYVYTVRGVRNYRVVINSASAGGDGVELALFYKDGKPIGGWKVV